VAEKCSAAEVKALGIDVVVVHPSPMATNFFQNSGGLQALESFKRFAVGPEVIGTWTPVFEEGGGGGKFPAHHRPSTPHTS
jgi:hypothetical protein